MQFSMYKTSIYNMRSVTISFFNLSVRLFFSFIESDKAKKKRKRSGAQRSSQGNSNHLFENKKASFQMCLSNFTLTKKKQSMSHILFS